MRYMLYIVAVILVIAWAFGFFYLEPSNGVIHLLLVMAVIAVVFSVILNAPQPADQKALEEAIGEKEVMETIKDKIIAQPHKEWEAIMKLNAVNNSSGAVTTIESENKFGLRVEYVTESSNLCRIDQLLERDAPKDNKKRLIGFFTNHSITDLDWQTHTNLQS